MSSFAGSMRALGAGVSLWGLAACAPPTNPPLVSTQFPPGTGLVNVNSPLQTLNSLPPGAANLGPGWNAVAPDYASIAFRAF